MHLQSHIKNSSLNSDSTLHVIGVIQNSVRYHSRYRLFHQWAAEMCATPNVKLYVVEATYGDRLPECSSGVLDYEYLQVKTNSEIWLKENLINIAEAELLPRNWKYMSWVDCDVSFRNSNWALDTVHQLQHYPVVQPWSDATDLSFEGGIIQHFKSLGSFVAKDLPTAPSGCNPYKHPYGHTGFAWACSRAFWENVRELMDFAILGAADNHMAWACLGKVEHTYNKDISQGYKDACNRWQEKAVHASRGIIGYTPGRIEHHFHGPKAQRKYWDRWKILVHHKYNPLRDLRYDSQGVIHLVGKLALEQAIMRYNRERMEDSIENY